MKRIGIVVGEDADLPENFVKKNKIIIFPFIINWSELKKDKDFYSLMRVSKTTPKTSQPAPLIFKKILEDSLQIYEEVLFITVSSKFSGTYNSAIQARKLLTGSKQSRVHIIDSESSSGAEGLLVIEALKLIEKNGKSEEIVELLKDYRSKICLVGVFDDPRWLVAGGRISDMKGLLVKNMLKGGLRPVLTIRDGEIIVKKIQINAKDRPEALFSQFKDEVGKQSSISVVITHADCKKDAEKLSNFLAKFSQSVKIEYIHEISPVIGCHLGPDTLLLSWVPR